MWTIAWEERENFEHHAKNLTDLSSGEFKNLLLLKSNMGLFIV